LASVVQIAKFVLSAPENATNFAITTLARLLGALLELLTERAELGKRRIRVDPARLAGRSGRMHLGRAAVVAAWTAGAPEITARRTATALLLASLAVPVSSRTAALPARAAIIAAVVTALGTVVAPALLVPCPGGLPGRGCGGRSRLCSAGCRTVLGGRLDHRSCGCALSVVRPVVATAALAAMAPLAPALATAFVALVLVAAWTPDLLHLRLGGSGGGCLAGRCGLGGGCLGGSSLGRRL